MRAESCGVASSGVGGGCYHIYLAPRRVVKRKVASFALDRIGLVFDLFPFRLLPCPSRGRGEEDELRFQHPTAHRIYISVRVWVWRLGCGVAYSLVREGFPHIDCLFPSVDLCVAAPRSRLADLLEKRCWLTRHGSQLLRGELGCSFKVDVILRF